MRYYTKFDIAINRILFTVVGLLIGSIYGLFLSFLLDQREIRSLSNSRISQSNVRVIYLENK